MKVFHNYARWEVVFCAVIMAAASGCSAARDLSYQVSDLCQYPFSKRPPSPCDPSVPHVEVPNYGYYPTCWRRWEEDHAGPPVATPVEASPPPEAIPAPPLPTPMVPAVEPMPEAPSTTEFMTLPPIE